MTFTTIHQRQAVRSRHVFKEAFTLVELLVVMAILGILMAMMVPTAGLILRHAARARARTDAGVVTTTVMKYWMEYNRWPSLPEGPVEDTVATDKDWVNVMAPKPGSPRSTNNFHMIVFFEPGGGALSTNGPYAGAFVDPWGHPYLYRVDRTGAGEVPHPDENIGGVLAKKVVAWSAGPDGLYDTWEDNETSWK